VVSYEKQEVAISHLTFNPLYYNEVGSCMKKGFTRKL